MNKSKSLQFFLVYILIGLLLYPSLIFGEIDTSTNQLRPYNNDEASERLIKNYLAVSGGRQAHQKIQNVVAKGRIKESSMEKGFELIETADGKRHLTYEWKHLGRTYRERYVFDGVQIWKQMLLPKERPADDYKGPESQHFAYNQWLLLPFTLPGSAKYVFEYRGTARIDGRSTYLIKGYGREDVPSWFYIDKEKFLVMRCGGAGLIAGVEEQLDYRATSFESVAGVMFPKRIDLIAENAPFGFIEFSDIKVNQDLSNLSFLKPKSKVPILRREGR